MFVRAGEPKMQTYAVDMNQCGPMILDALIKVSATPSHPARAGCSHLNALCRTAALRCVC